MMQGIAIATTTKKQQMIAVICPESSIKVFIGRLSRMKYFIMAKKAATLIKFHIVHPLLAEV